MEQNENPNSGKRRKRVLGTRNRPLPTRPRASAVVVSMDGGNTWYARKPKPATRKSSDTYRSGSSSAAREALAEQAHKRMELLRIAGIIGGSYD